MDGENQQTDMADSHSKSAPGQVEQHLPMSDDKVEKGPSKISAEVEQDKPSSTLQEIIAAMVAHHPEEVEAAMRQRQEEAAVRQRSGESPAKDWEVPLPAAPEGPSPPPTKTETARKPTPPAGPVIPREQFLSKYAVLDPLEQREWEKEAAAYMDGYENRADWVMEDRSTGTVLEFDGKTGCGYILEDGTGQSIFVNRRAVKRLSEPRWRHTLRLGERVSFAKLAGVKGFWAAGIVRLKDPADVVVTSDVKEQQPAGQLVASSGAWAESAMVKPPTIVGGSVYATGEATVTISH